MRALGLLGVTVVLVAHTECVAQEVVPALVPGARVRVAAPAVRAEPVIGRLVSLERTSLVVLEDGRAAPLTLLASEVRGLDASRGRRRWSALGAGIGAPVGAAVAVAAGPIIPRGGGGIVGCCGRGGEIVMDVVIGGAAGAFVGALVGWGFETERWQRVPLPWLRATVGPGRVGVSVSLAVVTP
jgi:hypothetical protein